MDCISRACNLRGKKGLRVVGDVSSFFRHSYGSDLVHYESELMPQFGIPVTALCKYQAGDIYANLSADISEYVKGHHNHVWEQ